MPSSGILRVVALVRTDISQKFGATIIRMTRIGELGTILGVTGNQKTKQTLSPLVCKRIIPTERPPLVDEI
jgi:hypothetical protein